MVKENNHDDGDVKLFQIIGIASLLKNEPSTSPRSNPGWCWGKRQGGHVEFDLRLNLMLMLGFGLNLRLNTKARAWQLMGLRSKTKRPRQEWNPFSQRWFGILWQRTSWYWNIKRPLVRNYPPSAYWWASGDSAHAQPNIWNSKCVLLSSSLGEIFSSSLIVEIFL